MVLHGYYCLFDFFNQQRRRVAEGAAERRQAVFLIREIGLQNVQQRDDDTRAGLSQRVAEGERAAPYVDLFEGRVIVVQLQLTDAGKRLAREGLVQLDRRRCRQR